jgi:hypothetical protein
MGDFNFNGDFDEKSLDTDLTDTEPNPDRWKDLFQFESEPPDNEFDRLDEWDDEEY